MKSNIIFTALLSMSLIANIQAQDKKRLKIIEKSIKQNSYELFKDTVYCSGIAKFLYKTEKGLSAIKVDKIHYTEVCDLKGNLICKLKWAAEEIAAFQKSKNALFWVNLAGIEGDARFKISQGGNELEMLKYLVEKNIVSNNGINKAEAIVFMKDNKVIKYEGVIAKECSMEGTSITIKNKNGEYAGNIYFPQGTRSAFVVAEGDKIVLSVGPNVYAETEITSKVEKITVSASCASFIKE